MTDRSGPSRGSARRGVGGWRLLARVFWNLRLLGFFLVGPGLGIVLAGSIFGLAPGLYWSAGIVFLFTLSLFALLVRGEWRRLAIGHDR